METNQRESSPAAPGLRGTPTSSSCGAFVVKSWIGATTDFLGTGSGITLVATGRVGSLTYRAPGRAGGAQIASSSGELHRSLRVVESVPRFLRLQRRRVQRSLAGDFEAATAE